MSKSSAERIEKQVSTTTSAEIPDAEDRIADINRLGKRYKGRKELIAHYEGKRLTRQQAIEAWCYDCSGFYGPYSQHGVWGNDCEGPVDCENPSCPLHPYMPYKQVKTDAKKRLRAVTHPGPKTQRKRCSNAMYSAVEE